MSHSKIESLHFYKYLCQKIGSEETVRTRRMLFISGDLSCSNRLVSQISSGSKGEGLDLKGSDLDTMIINPLFVVYELEKDAFQDNRIAFVMNTEETMPCFTHLQLYTNYNFLPPSVKILLRQHKGINLLSSKLFISHLSQVMYQMDSNMTIYNIHGPCLSDSDAQLDMAFCLKAYQWVSQAQPWISRPRLMWPSPELISKIISCGVLFVPIGNKGSKTEDLQWRISFSVAEKLLVYSFSHTTLLCYALLKIVLKEIVDRNGDLKGLLCSYFLKTLVFWISEEHETSFWRPDNIIPCFMACLKRLLYCIEYSTLLHYFIPDNNLFYLRFNSKQRNTLINTLKNSYQKGIQMFSSSTTLLDYGRFTCDKTSSVCEISTFMKTITEHIYYTTEQPFVYIKGMVYTLLHHSKTEFSRFIITLSIEKAYQKIPFALPHINNPNYKQQYKTYKNALSQLLVGVHSNAQSGWLRLVSFFYVHTKYFISIYIVNYTLSKCSDESLSTITLQQAAKLKLISVLKKLPSPHILFYIFDSSIIPTELKFLFSKILICISSIPYAHFLRFLCCYHLKDFKSCWYCINQLSETVIEHSQSELKMSSSHANNFILLGVAFQMLGESDRARTNFRLAALRDENNFTSAAIILHKLC